MINISEVINTYKEGIRTLQEFGIYPRVRLEDLEIDPLLRDGGYCYLETGRIRIGGPYLPTMVHEMYHKIAKEFTLEDDEHHKLNELRDSLVQKIRGEIIKRHSGIKRKERKEVEKRKPRIFDLEGKLIEEFKHYIVPCREDCQGLHDLVIGCRPYTFVDKIYVLENGEKEEVPEVNYFIDPFHFNEIFDPLEKYYISKFGTKYKRVQCSQPPEEGIVNVLEKLEKHITKLRIGTSWVDEGPAHLLSVYLGSPESFHNYEKLKNLLDERIYRSFNWGKTHTQTSKLAEKIVKNYKECREKGYSVRESIAQCIKPESLLKLKKFLRFNKHNFLYVKNI